MYFIFDNVLIQVNYKYYLLACNSCLIKILSIWYDRESSGASVNVSYTLYVNHANGPVNIEIFLIHLLITVVYP